MLYSLMPILAHGYLVVIHSYFASFGMVMDIIAQIHACMPCEAP
jgi:hypothetical protein